MYTWEYRRWRPVYGTLLIPAVYLVYLVLDVGTHQYTTWCDTKVLHVVRERPISSMLLYSNLQHSSTGTAVYSDTGTTR